MLWKLTCLNISEDSKKTSLVIFVLLNLNAFKLRATNFLIQSDFVMKVHLFLRTRLNCSFIYLVSNVWCWIFVRSVVHASLVLNNQVTLSKEKWNVETINFWWTNWKHATFMNFRSKPTYLYKTFLVDLH